MTLAQLVPVIIQISIWLIVFSLGLKAGLTELLGVIRTPALLVKGFLAMGVIMPAVAVVVVTAISPPHPVAIALIALALAPIPPLLPKKDVRAGGSEDHATGLLAFAALVSIVWIPLATFVLDSIFPVDLGVSPLIVIRLLIFSLFVPLTIGLIAHALSPALARRAAPMVARVATWLLLAAVIPVLLSVGPAILALVGNGTLLSIILFVLAGLFVGHVMGGPEQENRTFLALASATRHPGVAVGIAHAHFPNERAVIPSVMLYLIVATIAAVPYVRWRARRAAKRHAAESNEI